MSADYYRDLADHVEAHRKTRFEWGVHDCCLWAASCAALKRGEDLAAAFRGRYDSLKTARALIHAEFGDSIENIPGALGLEEVPLRRSVRGGIVSCEFPRSGVALGVCLGARAAFAGKQGLVFRDLTECRRAWKV